ncbi:MAG: FHA domain-containing protein [Elusimicrobia bacterium]|nr:FHA domain-containing protein [Elusimicrobiota bacterium]
MDALRGLVAFLEKKQWFFKVEGEAVSGISLSRAFHFVYAPMVFALIRAFTREVYAWIGAVSVVVAKEAMDLAILRRYGSVKPQAWVDSAWDLAVGLGGICLFRTVMEGDFPRLRRWLGMRARRASARSQPPARPARPAPAGTLSMAGLTKKAREGMRKAGGSIVLRTFPFKIGRSTGSPADALSDNDLALEDHAPFNVSQNHCSIDLDRERGGYVVLDLGSTLGTVVNGTRIGGDSGRSEASLDRRVNQVILGGEKHGWAFELTVSGV